MGIKKLGLLKNTKSTYEWLPTLVKFTHPNIKTINTIMVFICGEDMTDLVPLPIREHYIDEMIEASESWSEFDTYYQIDVKMEPELVVYLYNKEITSILPQSVYDKILDRAQKRWS